MRLRDVESHLGKQVFCTGRGDLFMDGYSRKAIDNKNLIFIKLTRGGMAYLQDTVSKLFYSIPLKNIKSPWLPEEVHTKRDPSEYKLEPVQDIVSYHGSDIEKDLTKALKIEFAKEEKRKLEK